MKLHASALAFTVAALSVAGGDALAEPHAGVDATLNPPAIDGTLSLEAARGPGKHRLRVRLHAGYAQSPLSLPVPGIGVDDAADPVLDSVFTARIAAALGVTDRLSVGVDVGAGAANPGRGYGERGRYRPDGSQPSTGLQSLRELDNIDLADGVHGRGRPTDLRVAARYALGGARLSAALIGIAHVPFGEDYLFLGDRDFVLEPRLAVELGASARLRVLVNAGARLRRRTVLEAYDPLTESMAQASIVYDGGSEATAGLGLRYELLPWLAVAGEVTYAAPLPEAASWGDCTRFDGTPCALIAGDMYVAGASYGDPAASAGGGVELRISPGVAMSVSARSGAWLGDGRGAPLEFASALIWRPADERAAIASGDIDDDRVPDAIDMCPDEAEDRDGYQDDDGCAEIDNDGDGVLDVEDRCPHDPEDRDGYQDDDGCAERDNDGDGVADVTDACPNDPEDVDRFEDGDGCPDEDNDGDGVRDDRDRCPDEPETVNGYDDTDGCPDEAAVGGPQLEIDRIDLGGSRIQFDRRDQLTADARTLLDDVAEVLGERPHVRIRVEVHVALGGKARGRRAVQRQRARDRAVAQRRAEAIASYLVERGVEPVRVQPAGIGSAIPIDTNNPAADVNERVELVRTEQQ